MKDRQQTDVTKALDDILDFANKIAKAEEERMKKKHERFIKHLFNGEPKEIVLKVNIKDE